MRRPAGTTKAFTIIELLVVIGVLALIMGLLMPALRAANFKGLKSREMSALKQVGIAWQVYSINNKEQVLPGFLDAGVQEQWNVRFQFPNHDQIPPAPGFSPSVDNIAGPWTWRLLPDMGYSHDMVHGYLDESAYDAATVSTDADEVLRMAFEPGFGYNAKYVGGWWTMIGDKPSNCDFDGSGDISPGEGESCSLIARSIASIKRSADLIIFCSSTLLKPGTYRNLPNNREGCHYAVPSKIGPDIQWTLPSGGGNADATSLLVENECAAPLGRYNRLAANLCADLHTETNSYQALTDMRKWIDRADKFNFEHP